MAQFNVRYGVRGGYYNDVTEDVVEAENVQQAEQCAYEMALEVFNSHGIFERACENGEYEDFEDDDDVEIAFREEADRWVIAEVYGATF